MTKPAPKTFQIKSYGCQMNVYDGDRMAELLEAEGLSAAGGDAADLVVLNTCHIREKAAEKVYSEIGRLKREDGSRPMIAVAGCVAQAEGAEIPRRAPSVDVVVGPQAYHRLPELIARARDGGRAIDTDMPVQSKFGALPGRRLQGPSAFLTVQEGCDKFCTYCVVPYTRGAEISRPWAAVMDEARALVDAGAKEIILLGQNVNAWAAEDGKGRPQGLDGLIRALDLLPGLERIRYTTSHPGDVNDGLIRAHEEVGKLMPYLHLPVQSGSDRVLKAMNRSHKAGSYLATLERVRAARPDIAISGDFIVGFPGEAEAEFEETLKIVEAVNYAQAYSFKYSPRPGTPAASMDDQVPNEVKDARLQRLQALLNEQQLAFNRATIGKRTSILIERTGKKPGQMVGKSPWLQSVHAETDAPLGALVEVEIVSAGPNSLGGTLVVPAKAGTPVRVRTETSDRADIPARTPAGAPAIERDRPAPRAGLGSAGHCPPVQSGATDQAAA
jgi:tRNA-2-methylthio-N6-dimethylallyladenosine synthase